MLPGRGMSLATMLTPAMAVWRTGRVPAITMMANTNTPSTSPKRCHRPACVGRVWASRSKALVAKVCKMATANNAAPTISMLDGFKPGSLRSAEVSGSIFRALPVAWHVPCSVFNSDRASVDNVANPTSTHATSCSCNTGPPTMHRFLSYLLMLALMGPTLAQAEKIPIAAAADLKFAMDEVIATFSKTHPGNEVSAVYGSSGNFQTQIRNGAPYDLYFSADINYPRALVSEGLARSEERRVG